MFDKSLIDHEIDLVTELLYIHTGAGYSCMKGSVYFVLKFALPAFSPPECKFQSKTCTEPFIPKYPAPVYAVFHVMSSLKRGRQ